MNKEFIPYEQAIELKELGFNEACITHYSLNDRSEAVLDINLEGKNKESYKVSCTAPLYQQVFRWFREKYNLASQIHPMTISGNFAWHYLIRNINEYLTEFDLENLTFDIYEEAELACLKKLIEIVKNK